jgi:hypothetical protein
MFINVNETRFLLLELEQQSILPEALRSSGGNLST